MKKENRDGNDADMRDFHPQEGGLRVMGCAYLIGPESPNGHGKIEVGPYSDTTIL